MKRSNTYDGGTSKKFKANLDELWGEDLDVNDVDDCFKLITENLSQASFKCTQRNNVSILPSYNIFKSTTAAAFSTSTQLKINQPSTSKTAIENGVGGVHKKLELESSFKRHRSFENGSLSLETKFKKLEETCLAREGEVNILRSQIRELRKNNERDYAKNQTEWNEKLKEAMRKLNKTTSELEFKSLEIVNLKQKFELLKVNGLSQLNQSLVSDVKVAPGKSTENEDSFESDEESELEDLLHVEEYPLENAFPSSTFEFCHRETYIIEDEEEDENDRETRIRQNPIPYLNLHLQQYYDKISELEPKITYLKGGKQLNFGYLHSELFSFMKFTLADFELKSNYFYFNKLLCTSEQLLDNFYQYLLTVQRGLLKYKDVKDEENTKKEPLVDDLYLSPLNSNHWYYNELGITARQGITCISEILPYCNYVKGYILLNENLQFTEKDNHLSFLPVACKKREENYKNSHDFIKLTILAVKLIKKLELEKNCSGFLCSVINFISKSCSCIETDDLIETLLYDLAFVLLSGKSTPNICSFLINFSRVASNKATFVNKLCSFPGYEHNCILNSFCEQLQAYLFKLENVKLSVPFSNFIKFSLNVIYHNPKWMYNQEHSRCECLKKFVVISIDVVYQMMIKYKNGLDDQAYIDISFDENLITMCISLLHLWTSKSYDLIVKCVDTYGQYMDVIKLAVGLKKYFEEEQHDEIVALKDLSLNDEMAVVDQDLLNSIELWKD